MSVNETIDHLWKSSLKTSKTNWIFIQWNILRKDLLLLATKVADKILDPCNAEEHCQSKISKIKNNYSVPKHF